MRSLEMDEVSMPGDLLVPCPTKLLFKIPLHALFGDHILQSQNPVLYTHAIPLLGQKFLTSSPEQITRRDRAVLIGNPIGDTSRGEESVNAIGKNLGRRARVFVGRDATKQVNINHCSTARRVHYHGYIITGPRALESSMVFHDGIQLQAKEVFSLDLHH